MEQPKHTTLGISRNQSEYKVITHSGCFRRSFLTSHRFLLLLLSFFLLLISHSHATILTVKQDGTGDFTSIQEAYVAASSSDTILVFPGTYYENINLTYSSKDITIGSLYLITPDKSYIHNTIIDGNRNGSCVAIRNTENAEIVICGFTIQNGSGYQNKNGGGFYIKGSNPKIINNIITNCFSLTGGGMFLKDTQTILSGNVIKYNHCNSTGGGIHLSIDATITFDTINKNSVYINNAGWGSDISKSMFSPALTVIVDTFTVINPDVHFILSYDDHGFPVDDISISIDSPKIIPVDADLYVNPITGNNSNTGLTIDEPLKSISFAIKKIYPDTLQPNKIYISDGNYSSSSNYEMLPISMRSYVSFFGNDRNNTIVDAEYESMILYSGNLTRDYSINNITFTNGFGNTQGIGFFGGFFHNYNENVLLENITIQNSISSHSPGIVFETSNKISISNSECSNNHGGLNVMMSNYDYPENSFKIINCKILNNGPDDNPEEGYGGGLGFSGNPNISDSYCGEIINLQITENLCVPDPAWGPGQVVGLFLTYKCNIDLVNATIGRNKVDGEMGFAVNVDDGAVLNVYNSMFFHDSLSEMSLGNYSGSIFPATANIAYSNIEGGEDEIMNWYNQHTLNWLDGNMDEDPLWAGTGDTAYYLLPGSPCINAGTPMYEEGMDYPYIEMEDEKIVLYKYDGDTIHLPPTDLAGKPRISGNRIDMGAYEYQDTTTGIGNPGKTSQDDNKVQFYPNPFSAQTFITFRIQNPAQVVVKITNINGRPVKTLMNAKLTKGEYSMTWKGDDDEGDVVKNGTYIVTIYLNGVAAKGVKMVKRNGG